MFDQVGSAIILSVSNLNRTAMATDHNCTYFHTFVVKKLGKRAASCKVPLCLVFGRAGDAWNVPLRLVFGDGSNFLRGKNLMKKSEEGGVTPSL